jgi:uncharacterized protein (DUF2141 family)
MTRAIWLCLPLLLALLLPCTAATQAHPTGNLEIQVTGLQTAAGGQLRVALYRGDRGWPKMANARQLQTLAVDREQLSLRFENLPYAEDYAILVHHDQNGNGKFDMRWFPYPRPKEGVGVSNNIHGFGSPKFSAARFTLSTARHSLTIEMRY